MGMRRMWGLVRAGDWRMLLAHAWDRIFRRSCWAESCCWAMRVEGCRLRIDADRREGGYCPDGVHDRVGCWCGKFRAKGGD